MLFVVFILVATSMFAQQDGYANAERCLERRGLEYGGVAGIYLPDKSTAGFYSGKPGNENNVEYVFKNQYWYNEIYQLLRAYDTVIIREYPDNMKYNPAFSFGLFAKFDLNCHTGIFLQFYYAKLKAADAITIEVDPPIDYLAEPDIRICPIIGTEERNMVDLGFTHAFGINPIARFVLTGGIQMNNSLVKEHILRIERKNYNLVNVYGKNSYIPGGTQQAYEIRQGGIGFGIFAGAGVRLEFSNTIAIEPGLNVYYKHSAIDPSAGFTPDLNFYVKLCFRDLLSFNE